MSRSTGLRLAAAGSVLAGVLALVTAVPATAGGHGDDRAPRYLALGDSVAFGYNPLLVHPGVNPHKFLGYPDLAARMLGPDLKVANASCVGETSTSLITGTRPDHGCQDYRQFIGALHTYYTGSQLQYAEDFVAANPRTKLITLDIGANDLFILQESCSPAPDLGACISAGLPALLTTLSANLVTIYSGLRAAGFTGDFVVVTYYSLNYADPGSTGAIGAVDQVLAGVTTAFGGKVADGFSVFQAATAPFGGDACAAGLLIRFPDMSCDVHPSRAGAALLAHAVREAEGPMWPQHDDR